MTLDPHLAASFSLFSFTPKLVENTSFLAALLPHLPFIRPRPHWPTTFPRRRILPQAMGASALLSPSCYLASWPWEILSPEGPGVTYFFAYPPYATLSWVSAPLPCPCPLSFSSLRHPLLGICTPPLPLSSPRPLSTYSPLPSSQRFRVPPKCSFLFSLLICISSWYLNPVLWLERTSRSQWLPEFHLWLETPFHTLDFICTRFQKKGYPTPWTKLPFPFL